MSQKKSWDPIDAISVLLTHVAFWSVLALTLIIASAISLVFVHGTGWQILAIAGPGLVVGVALALAENRIYGRIFNRLAATYSRLHGDSQGDTDA